jgi:hypothetical protein
MFPFTRSDFYVNVTFTCLQGVNMITRRFVLTGLVAAPAIIAADKLMKVHSLPERYATVYGVGWDLEVIEHPIWQPMSVAYFGGTPAIDQFREVTDWVYAFPVEPMPKPIRPAYMRATEIIDPIQRLRDRSNRPYDERDTSVRYRLAEDMGASAQVDIWDPGRAAKEDLKPYRAEYDYVIHSRKLGRDEA